ncbi:MAG: DUF819 family protein [Bacteroidetes bacterium]|nr:DUF819 family protein [Bacteroidota bacterium]
MTPWLITTFTVIAIYYLDKWENKYLKSIFDWIPAILLAYIIPALISSLMGQSFANDEIHQYSKSYFIPLAIIAVMSSLSIKQLKSIGWKPLLIFVSGSFWIALFPVVLVLAFQESNLVKEVLTEQEYWKGIPPIVGSWIGGSTSQLVLKELVNCPENVFLTILILDNILVNIWTILMFQGIKKSNGLNKLLGITNPEMPNELPRKDNQTMNPLICFISFVLIVLIANVLIETFILKIIVLSILGLLISNFISNWNYSFVLKFGSILILVVMAILGLKLSFSTFNIGIELLSFLMIWLVSHFIFMLLVAKALNANIAWVPIASMANVGGIATAPAVTAAYEKKWMPHAIILAILSMATGTFWGMLTIYLLKELI